MKTITLTLSLFILWTNNVYAQHTIVTYDYIAFNKNQEDTTNKLPEVVKVYVNNSDYNRAIVVRLLNNNLYERIHYTKKTIDNPERGSYVISDKNIIYFGTSKVPKWYNFKKYESYSISNKGLHNATNKELLSEEPTYKYTDDKRIYNGWNFNVLSNQYYFGKQRARWGLPTFSKKYGAYSLYDFIEQRFIDLSNDYLPEYSTLLTTSYAPIQNYQKEVNSEIKLIKNDTSTYVLLSMLSTVLHESIHQKQFDLSDEHFFGYYLPGEELKAKKNASIFKSEEMFNSNTDSLIFYIDNINYNRIYSYLNGTVSSNINGIYGLLDEFSAYAHTANINIKLLNKLTADSIFNDLVKQELDDVKSIPDNFYCFNYMIAWHLDYAKKYYPEVYKELYANKELRKAYTSINTFFEQQLEKYYELEKKGIVTTNYKQNKKYRGLLNAYESKKFLLDEFKI